MIDRGWTGGQYSLFRASLACCLAGHLVIVVWRQDPALPSDPWIAGLILSISAALISMLAAGAGDRAAALLLAAGHAWFHVDPLLAMMPGEIAITCLLLLHAATPAAPYGSWHARQRDDPDGGWHLPERVSLLIWAAVAIILVLCLHAAFPSAGWALAFLALPLLWFGRNRFTAWAAALLATAGLVLFGDVPGPLLPLVLVFALAFDPAWIAPAGRPVTATLFFDGNCALCHGAVRFLLAEDRDERFVFSPIGGELFHRTLSDGVTAGLPDSMLLVTDQEQILSKSDAVIACLHGLGGLWRLFAPMISFLPKPLRDGAYDLIGSRRYAVFGKKAETCPMMTAAQRRRFLA